uniref:Putative iron/ascorbate family oxidoreductase n=1 Tax=Tabanus bromius TaxID=304241 RepID=A0A0K8TT73_TABBR
MLKAKTVEEKIDTLLSRSQIPIIDLAHCGTEEIPLKSVLNRVASQLQKALSEKGVVFIVNHGIAEEKLKTAWKHLDNFCELPTEVKEHYIRKGDDNHGYVLPGQEKVNGKDPALRHAFNICTLNSMNLPEEPLPGFAEHVANLARDFKLLASFLLQALAIALELPQIFFIEKHSHMLSGDHDNETTLRLLYYPPIIEDDDKCEFVKGRCKYSYQRCASDTPDFRPNEISRDVEEENASGSTDGKISARCGAHSDYGTFTLLAQDSEGGLEAKLPGSGKWQRIGYLPGAILMNCGEILSIWTDGRYPALNHRVVIPEQEHIRSRGRHAIAFVCHPDNVTMISPADLLSQTSSQEKDAKKPRKKSFKTAKDKVCNAYQLIQRRIKEAYGS